MQMNQEKYPFIFANDWRHRITRHVAFWLVWVVFQGFLYASTPHNFQEGYWKGFSFAMLDSCIYVFIHIFFAYSLMYFVVPQLLLRQRYWLTFSCTIILVFLTAFLSVLLTQQVVTPLRARLLGEAYLSDKIRVYNEDFYKSLLAGLRGGLTIGGMAAAIKLMKHWYLKEQRNLQLQKENIAAQLQLLKAQVHPHFLFNTLNNIYSYTQNTSPVAAKMVTGLSDMLRFILYEANHAFVPLHNELKMVQDYISLEQIRYGNKLEIQLDLPDNCNNLYIAPLLLLPLVENCFKHGASNMLEHPWISMSITINGTDMQMKLINGKPLQEEVEQLSVHHGGIGISNVQKRLAFIYPNKHELCITNDVDVFIVNLKISLEQRKNNTEKTIIQQEKPAPAYA